MTDRRAGAGGVAGLTAAPAGVTPLRSGVAPAFGPQGLAAVHASLLDSRAMSCEARWTITEDGNVHDAVHELDFARSMTTIVCLDRAGGRDTVTRQLGPQRWACGWRVDDRRVIVAEVLYRMSRGAPTDSELALVRRLCDGRVRLVDTDDPPDDDVATLPGFFDETEDGADAGGRSRPSARRHRPAGTADAAGPFALFRGWGRPALLAALLAACLAAGALGYMQWRRSEALAGEAQRLQALSEATLAQGIAAAAERGDYGELQSELDRFHELRYFDVALVANARGQVVARSGSTPGVRIGENLRPEAIAGSRTVELRGAAVQDLGRLYVWPVRSAAP